MKTIQIAIDGPASSGKSTVAKIIAKDFGYTYLDTGAMYRAATYMALKNQLGVEEVEALLSLLDQHPISFGRSEAGEQLVFVGDVDITHPIRENEVTNYVSAIAAIPEVREKTSFSPTRNRPARWDCHGWSRYWNGCIATSRIENFPSSFCR